MIGFVLCLLLCACSAYSGPYPVGYDPAKRGRPFESVAAVLRSGPGEEADDTRDAKGNYGARDKFNRWAKPEGYNPAKRKRLPYTDRKTDLSKRPRKDRVCTQKWDGRYLLWNSCVEFRPEK